MSDASCQIRQIGLVEGPKLVLTPSVAACQLRGGPVAGTHAGRGNDDHLDRGGGEKDPGGGITIERASIGTCPYDMGEVGWAERMGGSFLASPQGS